MNISNVNAYINGPSITSFEDDNAKRQSIWESKDFSSEQVKKILPNVDAEYIQEITFLLNKKIHELKLKLITFDALTLNRMSINEFIKEIDGYIKQISIEYDKYGLKRIYDKIQTVLEKASNDGKYVKDVEIILEIRNEYVMTKKLNKSSILYLNKIYKELMRG